MPESPPPTGPDDQRRSRASRRLNTLTSALVYGAAATLVLVLVGLAIRDAVADSLLEYREDGLKVTVGTDDGCLRYRKDRGGRSPDIRLKYCGWERPEGVAEWAPQTREMLVLDAARRHVVEVVAFGMLPD